MKKSVRLLLAAGLLAALLLTRPALGAELNSAKLLKIHAAMQQFVDRQEIAGAVTLVGRHDGVALLDAVGFQDIEAKKPMRGDCLFRIASMTKPVTSLGIMILAEEGKLSVDDPVCKYLPEFPRLPPIAGQGDKANPKIASRPITIRDLLTHTSGMPGGLPPDVADLYVKRNRTLAEGVRAFAKRPLKFEPGSKWSYCNLGMDTLGRVVEVVSGQPYEKFLAERIFKPLRMVDTCFYPTLQQLERLAITYRQERGKLVGTKFELLGPPLGAKYPIPAGGLYSTASDLARLYRMMLNRGTLDGQRILTPVTVATMTKVHTGELAAAFTPGMGFGFGWGVVRQPTGVTEMLSPGTFGHGGAFGTQAWLDPTKDLFMVLLIQRMGLRNGDNSEMRRELQVLAVAALVE